MPARKPPSALKTLFVTASEDPTPETLNYYCKAAGFGGCVQRAACCGQAIHAILLLRRPARRPLTSATSTQQHNSLRRRRRRCHHRLNAINNAIVSRHLNTVINVTRVAKIVTIVANIAITTYIWTHAFLRRAERASASLRSFGCTSPIIHFLIVYRCPIPIRFVWPCE